MSTLHFPRELTLQVSTGNGPRKIHLGGFKLKAASPMTIEFILGFNVEDLYPLLGISTYKKQVDFNGITKEALEALLLDDILTQDGRTITISRINSFEALKITNIYHDICFQINARITGDFVINPYEDLFREINQPVVEVEPEKIKKILKKRQKKQQSKVKKELTRSNKLFLENLESFNK